MPTSPSFSNSSRNSLNLQQLSMSPSPPTTKEQLINFEKFRFLTKNIHNIKRYTSESYSFANQLSRPPRILTSTISLFSDQNDLINALVNNDLNRNGSNNGVGNSDNNSVGSGIKPAPLDHIGEIIESRIFAAAGSIFGNSITSIAMLDGSELEAELMALSLEAEPAANFI